MGLPGLMLLKGRSARGRPGRSCSDGAHSKAALTPKSAKWVRGLELLDHDQPGFWESYGYHSWPGHQAGQHLDVRLTAEDGYQAERSYSIAADDEPVAITVERLDDGEVSPYLTEDLRPGDQLELRGP